MPGGAQLGGCWQTLAPISPYISFTPAFPSFLSFSSGFFCILLWSFAVMFMKHFFVYFLVKQMSRMPPLCLHCWTSVHVGCKCLTRTRVCVSSSFIAVWLCTCAEHSHTLSRPLTICYSITKPSSSLVLGRPPPALLKPAVASAPRGCSHGLTADLEPSQLPWESPGGVQGPAAFPRRLPLHCAQRGPANSSCNGTRFLHCWQSSYLRIWG